MITSLVMILINIVLKSIFSKFYLNLKNRIRRNFAYYYFL